MKKNALYYLLVIVFLFLLPLFIKQQYIINIMVLASIMAILSVSWNLLSGYLGIFSFGHPAFYGFGAYTSALLSLHTAFSPWITMFIGGGFAAFFSFVVALPTLRLRGPYVAVVTLAFMLILGQVCHNWISLTQGPMGLLGIPTLTNFKLFGKLVNFAGISRVPYYYVIMIILIITMYVAHRIVNSRLGLHLMAIRESEEAAAATGVRITRNKIGVFMISSFFAGWVGAFYAHYILILTPDVFAFFVMASILASTLIGGWGTLFGPAIGAFILTFLIDYAKNLGDIHHFLYGSFLIIAILFMPKGVIVSLQKSFLIVRSRFAIKGEK